MLPGWGDQHFLSYLHMRREGDPKSVRLSLNAFNSFANQPKSEKEGVGFHKYHTFAMSDLVASATDDSQEKNCTGKSVPSKRSNKGALASGCTP